LIYIHVTEICQEGHLTRPVAYSSLVVNSAFVAIRLVLARGIPPPFVSIVIVAICLLRNGTA
jgi:hypothetical protein